MEGLKETLDKYEIDIRHEPIGRMGTDKSFIGMKTIFTYMPTEEEDHVNLLTWLTRIKLKIWVAIKRTIEGIICFVISILFPRKR